MLQIHSTQAELSRFFAPIYDSDTHFPPRSGLLPKAFSMTELILIDHQFGSRARLLPEVGFNCFSLQIPVAGELVEVLDADPDFVAGDKRGTRSGIPWLFPFPNRIERGRYLWNGVTYELPVSDTFGNAIHGFVMDRPWRVATADTQTAIAEFQLSVDAPERLPLWPSDFLLEVRYTLRRACLRADVRIVNAGDQPLPWGLGTHPYFKLPFGATSQFGQCLVQVPAEEAWELYQCLPTGHRSKVHGPNDLRTGLQLEGAKLDDVLTGLTRVKNRITTSIMDPQAGIQMTQITDWIFRECVVFTPPGRSCVCIEPYTCVTNAINLQREGIESGWQVLGIGEEYRTWWEIHLGQILA